MGELTVPPTFWALAASPRGSVVPFATLDEALYWLWLMQRSYLGKALGVYDGTTIYVVRDQLVDELVRRVFKLPVTHVFARRVIIKTSYYWEHTEQMQIPHWWRRQGEAVQLIRRQNGALYRVRWS